MKMRDGVTLSMETVLEFYRALGFERLPFRHTAILTEEGQATDRGIEGVRGARGETVRAGKYPSGDKEAGLKALRQEIGGCTRCKLSKGRSHIVFGEGNLDARILFIGEAPGREEDLQGRPFVGDAGQLLTRLIERMGFKRSDVYIANIVKCRPPMNRDPQEDEIATCLPFLQRQIEILSPEVIVSLGRISAHTLMGVKVQLNKFAISRIRGRFFEYVTDEASIPVMPTFHPAYLLRNPRDKWLTWEDAQAVLRRLNLLEDSR